MASFAERIRELRAQKGFTLREMAIELNVDYSAISKWERGLNSAPQDMVISLASYFGVSTDYLLGRTDDPRPFPVEDTRSILEKNDPFLVAVCQEAEDLTLDEREEILAYIDFVKGRRNRLSD